VPTRSVHPPVPEHPGDRRGARLRRPAALLASLSLVVAGLAGCTAAARPAADPGPTDPGSLQGGTRDDLVTRSGAGFVLGAEPFRFVGFNLYDAASSPKYTCVHWTPYTDTQLDNTFAYLHDTAGVTVIRFWAYQTYTEGGTYWAGMDRVLRAARLYDMKVLPVLEDGPGNCSTGVNGVPKTDYDGDTWYSTGYKVPYGSAKLSYRDYVRVVTAHYRGNPTIFGWSMMNEAETDQRDSQGRSELVDFAQDIASVIKKADPTHLLTVGSQSNGAPGASGPDFTAVYSLPQIDFAEVHDYADRGSDTQALPGGPDDGTRLPSASSATCRSRSAPISCSMAEAVEVLHKPFIVGEAGIGATGAAGRARRAVLFRAKMTAAFRVGASGYLVWQVNNVEDTDYDVLTTDADPLIPTMGRIAAGLKD
jgi:mannan endo-1,4-beta-mannosidase